jgi:hypothetical protein
MSYRFKKWGQVTKVCINSPVTGVVWLTTVSVQVFWRCDVITDITSGEPSGPYEMIAPAPGYSLVIIGHCPHSAG